MKPVTVVGGGLAGLALAIHLRRLAVPVMVFESGHYPRHRVCGEFISGHGTHLLRNLLPSLGPRGTASTALFVSGSQNFPWRLPVPALCISRFDLDALLATTARESGAEILEGTRWTGGIREGVVCATGRVINTTAKQRWIGLKAHATGIALRAGLEMHFFSDSYVGLNEVGEGRVNVCGLFRTSRPVPNLNTAWPEMLRGAVGSSLRELTASAVFDPQTFSAVAGLSPEPEVPPRDDVCRLGDAIGMVPPVTGNGMSVAFESAALAAPELVRFSEGLADWKTAQSRITHALRERFAPRFRGDRLLQKLIMFAPGRAVLFRSVQFCPALLDRLFNATR
jgi:flavin-dependent dehydrogenase